MISLKLYTLRAFALNISNLVCLSTTSFNNRVIKIKPFHYNKLITKLLNTHPLYFAVL